MNREEGRCDNDAMTEGDVRSLHRLAVEQRSPRPDNLGASEGRIEGSKPDLQRLLGIETSFELDAFLRAHDVWIEYSREDAERESRGLQRLVSDASGRG